MNNNYVQPNEAVVTATVVDGNPAIPVKNDFDQKTFYACELGVPKGSKAAQKIEAAEKVALDHGEKHCNFNRSLVPPKSPSYDGDIEALRKPHAEGKLVIRVKSTSIPLLLDADGKEDIDPNTWTPGTKVRALVAFFPYNFNDNIGVSAKIKFLGLVKKAEVPSLRETAISLLSDLEFEDEEA